VQPAVLPKPVGGGLSFCSRVRPRQYPLIVLLAIFVLFIPTAGTPPLCDGAVGLPCGGLIA
jgi:hypothetical protein